MKKWDIFAVAMMVGCLVLAFIALHSVPIAYHIPRNQSRYLAGQNNDNRTIGQQGLTASQVLRSNRQENWGNYQNNEDYWSKVKRRLPDSVTLQTLFDFGLVIIGILQCFIYSNMRHDSLVKDRAFVFLREISGVWKVMPDGTFPAIEVSPKWENAGSVSAFRVWLQVSVEVRPDDLPLDFDFPDRWQEGETRVRHPTFLAPHAFVFGSPRTISSTDAFLLTNKTMRVFIYGWIEYDDSHKPSRRRRTEFCTELEMYGSDKLTGLGVMRFMGYGRHNGVDEQCLRKPMPYVAPPQGIHHL